MRYPGGLCKAVTLSYDDGVIEDEKLIGIMRKYGLKGTFNIDSKNLGGANGRCLTSDEIKNIYGDDMEIAVHGYEHICIPYVLPEMAMREVIADRENLEKTFGRIVRGMAYPYGDYDDKTLEILRLSGIVYSRTTKSTHSFELPSEWLTLHPTCHHRDPELFNLVEKFLEPDKNDRFWTSAPKLFYLWGHSYEFPRDNNWEVIEKFGEIMASRDDVWHATNMEIYDYVTAFTRLVFSLDYSMIYNPSSIDVYVRVFNKYVVAKAGETTIVK
jgi:peptidoglycan/xylan/chitin deacetylase (PgdA/CDA1 family)